MDNFSSLPLILYAGNYNGRNYGKYNGKLHFHDGMELVFIKCGSCINRTPEGEYPSRAGDLLVMFSFSKVSSEGRMILDYRKEAGYRTLAFTSRIFIPEGEKADIQIFVYRREADEYHAMTAPPAIVGALVVAVSEQMGVASAEGLSHLHRMKKI